MLPLPKPRVVSSPFAPCVGPASRGKSAAGTGMPGLVTLSQSGVRACAPTADSDGIMAWFISGRMRMSAGSSALVSGDAERCASETFLRAGATASAISLS